ncbi:Rsph1, partial [Symbiodinium sp. KB8]
AKVVYPNGDEFVGEFNESGEKVGKGVYTWSVGEVKYEGDYARGLKNGIGKIAFPNGDRYHGMWEDGAIHGEGTYFYRNGDIYSGNWEHGKRAGKGAFVFGKDRSQLIGTWVNGQMSDGKWVFADGTSYHGSFKNNKPIGKGVFYFPNGNQQEGEYVEVSGAASPRHCHWPWAPHCCLLWCYVMLCCCHQSDWRP